jgi:type II secretory pathway pseudopilin PulG
VFQPVRQGLSKVEVLVVLAIGGVVVAMLIPAFSRVHNAAERMQCSNNLKRLILGIQEYESTGQRVADLPAGASDGPTTKHSLFPPGCVGPGDTPEARLSWMVAVLPFLDQEALYRQFDVTAGYADNLEATRGVVKPFQCTNWQRPATEPTTHYVAMAGIGADAATRPTGADGNGFMGYDRPTHAAVIRDGRTNTIALMETRSEIGPWARGGPSTVRGFDPADTPHCGDGRPFGGHAGGYTGVAMADGSLRSVRSNTDPKGLAAAITIAGGEKDILD